MLEWIRFGPTAAFFAAGLITLFVSIFGVYRMDYSLNRLHAAAVTDTLVLMFFISGCIVASGISITSAKLFITLAVQWCTSPLVSHMFVKAKLRTDDSLCLHCNLPEEDKKDKEAE